MSRTASIAEGLVLAAAALAALGPWSVAPAYPFGLGAGELEAVSVIDVAAPPVCGAAGAIACLGVIAAAAGRGRPVPGARRLPAIRAGLACFLLGLEVYWIFEAPRVGWVAVAGWQRYRLPLVLLVAGTVAAESALWPGSIAQVLSFTADELYRLPWLGLPAGLAYAAALAYLKRRLKAPGRASR